MSDQPIFRAGLKDLLQTLDQNVDILELSATDSLGGMGDFDLVLADVPLRGGTGQWDYVSDLIGRYEATPVAIMSEHDTSISIRRCLDLGAKGVLSKRLDGGVVLNAVRLMLSGGRFVPDSVLDDDPHEGFGLNEALPAGIDRLTRRQLDVLKELGRGRSNQEIAGQLGIALATVKLHVNAVLNVLGVRNRTEAAIISYRAGLTDFDKDL